MAQKYSRNNYWKHLDFFHKMYLVKKVAFCQKPQKTPFRLIKRFLQTENFKKCKGVPCDKIRKFSKNKRKVPKKQRGDPLVSPVLLEAFKNYGLVRESNPRSRLQKIGRS